jgi:ATP sulfurylase
MQSEIAPHGGKLVNAFVSGDAAGTLRERAQSMTKIHLADRRLSDLEMIGCGAFSPLGRLHEARRITTTLSVNKRLANGLPWTIPITLAVTSDEAENLSIDDEVALVDKYENILAVLTLKKSTNTTASANRAWYIAQRMKRIPACATCIVAAIFISAGAFRSCKIAPIKRSPNIA